MKRFIVIILLFFTCCFSVNAQNTKPYALIAGGSKGIGYAISEALAKRGYNLILVARHEKGLQASKEKLETTYHVTVETLAKDLADRNAASEIADWCTKRNIPLKVLCNVAGLGGANDFLTLPADTLRYMINVNLESPVVLTYLLLPLLEKNAPSHILNVASMAAYGPMPQKNLYSATKSGLLYFSYSLKYQLQDKNITVSCLTPGPVFTKQEIVEETKKQLGKFGTAMAVAPAKVGEIAVRKTLKGRMIIVPGTLSSISSVVIRALPKRWSASFYHQLSKNK